MIFTREQMRMTILGKAGWIKCMSCDGTGFENWDEDGHDIKSGRTEDQNRTDGECENCGSLGFVTGYAQ